MGWETRLQVGVEAVAVPLPLQRFPWTIAVGHRTMQQYHFPTIVTPEQPLAAGSLTFGTNVLVARSRRGRSGREPHLHHQRATNR
jgi:hypothetical protein